MLVPKGLEPPTLTRDLADATLIVIALARQPFTGWQGGLADSDCAAIADAVAVTGVEPFLRRYFSDLSDGERQRVMIARALAQTPRLMARGRLTAGARRSARGHRSARTRTTR